MIQETNVAEMIARAKAIRARLFRPANALVEPPALTSSPTQRAVEPRFEWPDVATATGETARPDPFRWRRILAEVAKAHGLTTADLIGQRRARHVIRARQEAYHRLYRETKLSLPEIGRRMKRDHTSILHGVRAHHRRLKAARAATETAPAERLTEKWRRILCEVAAAHCLTPADLVGPRRNVDLARARQEASWRLLHETDMTKTEISFHLNRDRTTILDCVRAHQRRLDVAAGTTAP